MSFDGTQLLARERDARILCILEVKKSMNLLHCVTVWLWCGEKCLSTDNNSKD